MTADILQQIVGDRRADLLAQTISLADIKKIAADVAPPRDFVAALYCAAQKKTRLPVIAEIKHRSPSKGVLRADFAADLLAAEYDSGGAACLSVLTNEKYFGGSATHLSQARAACDLPLLRKDFMIDEWQIYESRALGADAVLLIAAVLSVTDMQKMAKIAAELGMAVLIESHNKEEILKARQIPNAVLGINNRNLNDFSVSLQTTEDLIPFVEDRFIVAESGIGAPADIRRLSAAGANAFLIGETLMRAKHPGIALQQLFN